MNRIVKLVITYFIIVGTALNCFGCKKGKDSNEVSTSITNNENTLVVVDWGGENTVARKKAMIDSFGEEYGINIKVVTPTDYGKLKAMVTGNCTEWDVVNVDSDFVIRAGKEGLLEPLDYNVIDATGVEKSLVQEYGIGAETYSTVISYNTDDYTEENHPKTWADFWNVEKYPGDRALWKYPVTVLEAALLADGVKPDELYPLDVDRAFKSLDKIKEHIKVWWTAGAQSPQLLATGEVSLSGSWNGRVLKAASNKAPEAVEYNQGIMLSASWVVPKNAPHKKLAMEFINYATKPEQQLKFSQNIDYGSMNQKAVDLMDKDLKERLGQTDELLQSQIKVNWDWWVENFDEVNERFQKWLLE